MLPVLFILAIAFHYLGDERFLTAQNLSIVAQQAAINVGSRCRHDLRHPHRRH